MADHVHRRHLLLMLLCCLVPLVALVAVTALRVPVGRLLTYGLVLLCPLSHVLMMRAMGHKRGNSEPVAMSADEHHQH